MGEAQTPLCIRCNAPSEGERTFWSVDHICASKSSNYLGLLSIVKS